MVPIAQSRMSMRCFRRARNPDIRGPLSSLIVRPRTMRPYSIALALAGWSTCGLAYRFQDFSREVRRARRRHDVGAADQGSGPRQQVLRDLDAVLRGLLGGELRELLPYMVRDVDTGDLVVEELRLASAPQGHQAEEDADPRIVDLLQRTLQGPDLEDRLCPEGVRPGLDLAPQPLHLGAQILGRRVEGGPDEEAGRLAYRVSSQVLARVHAREDVYEADRVRVEDGGGLGVVPDLGRVPGYGEDVLYPEGRGPEEVSLQPDDVPITARDVGDDLDSGLVLHDPGRRDGVHPEAGARPVRDVYGIHPAALEMPGGLDHGCDVVAPREVQLHRYGETAPEPLGEARGWPARDPGPLRPLHYGDPLVSRPSLDLKVPQRLR